MAPKKNKKPVTPTHVRRACLARSTKNSPPIFPEASWEKYKTLSPNSQEHFVARGDKSLGQLKHTLKQRKLKAQAELFKPPMSPDAPGPSKSPEASTPKKKRANAFVSSPDSGLSPDNPGRDCSTSSLAKYVDTPPPKKKGKAVIVD